MCFLGGAKKSYRYVAAGFRKYWVAYGGRDALLGSPYLHLSALMGLVLFLSTSRSETAGMALDVLPNLLGFTLGAFAVLVTFGDRAFHEELAIHKTDRGVSSLEQLLAAFVHFIILQFLALMMAIVSLHIWQGWMTHLAESILFTYALFSMIAAVMGVMSYSRIYGAYLDSDGGRKPRRRRIGKRFVRRGFLSLKKQ